MNIVIMDVDSAPLEVQITSLTTRYRDGLLEMNADALLLMVALVEIGHTRESAQAYVQRITDQVALAIASTDEYRTFNRFINGEVSRQAFSDWRKYFKSKGGKSK